MDMEIVFPGGAQVDAVLSNGMVITTDQDGSAPAPFHPVSVGDRTRGIYVLSFASSAPAHRGAAHRSATTPTRSPAWSRK